MAQRRFKCTRVSMIRTLGYSNCPDGLPLGVCVLAPSLHYVESPREWTGTLRHNLHSAAILTSLAEAEP